MNLNFNLNLKDMMESRIPSADEGLLHKIGFRRNIRISNSSDKKAYVILTPTPIKSISTIGVEKLGNIQYEQHGEYKSEEMMLLPGKQDKYFELETNKIYISVLIEVEENNWKQWRKNRLIDSKNTDYNITKDSSDECIDTSFLDYTRK
jgi:hypothetical protein